MEMLKSRNYISENSFIFIPMSNGSSFKKWKIAGLIDRELAYYGLINEMFSDVKFNTYDCGGQEVELLKQYIPDSSIVYQKHCFWNKFRFGNLISSIVLPLVFKNKFRECIIVRTNQFSGAITGLIVAKTKKIPFVLRGGYLLSEFSKKENKRKIKIHFDLLLEKILVRNSDHVIVTYEKMKRYFEDKYNIPENEISVIGNPIDTNKFCKKQCKDSKKRDIVFIGRFTEQKNIFSLLEACGNLNASITLVGKGEQKERLQIFVNEKNVNAIFKENIPNNEIPQLMNMHKVFVIPSFFEGNPKVLLEAMSCEMICIASNIEEHTSIIQNGKNGLICDFNSASIEDKISYSLKNYQELNNVLGKNARETIKTYYSMRGNAQKEVNIYKNLLSVYEE